MKNLNRYTLALATSVTFPVAFENKNGWKLDADGKIEMKDGNPVYVDASGREMVVDQSTVSRLNGEAKTHREAKEAAERELNELKEKFKDLDPVKAREALDKLTQIDQKQLIDAGKVEEVKRQITETFQTQIAERDKKLSDLSSELDNTKISHLFSQSEFVRNNVAVPLDMFEATFRNNFKVENGKIVAYGRDGNPIYSPEKFSEHATPEEAFAILVDKHPNKDMILKAPDASGSGNNGNGGNGGRGRVMKRAEFEKLAPNKQAEHAAMQQKGELQIVD